VEPDGFVGVRGLCDSWRPAFLPIESPVRQLPGCPGMSTTGEPNMGKGNNARKNDKKTMKPKQDKAKPAAKK
jgi:hypothetical protein